MAASSSAMDYPTEVISSDSSMEKRFSPENNHVSLEKVKCLVLLKLVYIVPKHMQNQVHLMIHHIMIFLHVFNNVVILVNMVEWCVGG